MTPLQALPGVRWCRREKGKIWLVRFWQLNKRGAIGGSGGGIQMHETPVQALISFSLPLPHHHSPGRACSQAICRSKNALRGKYRHRTLDAFLLAKGKEREGFIKPNWCGRVLRLSILCYYKTYKKILIVWFYFCCCCCFLFFVWAHACMSPRHACVSGEE